MLLILSMYDIILLKELNENAYLKLWETLSKVFITLIKLFLKNKIKTNNKIRYENINKIFFFKLILFNKNILENTAG